MKKFMFALAFAAIQLLGAEKILLFSDTHFDGPKWHQEDPKRMWLVDQINRYSSVWAGEDSYGQVMLKNAAKREFDKVFLLGDNLEGYICSPEALTDALNTYMAMLKRYLGEDKKYYAVIGNHEYAKSPTDPDPKKNNPKEMRDAFFSASSLLGIGTQKRNFAVREGANLFIFWDNIAGADEGFKFIQKTIKRNPDAVNKFLICHLPVLPCSPGSRWLVYGYAGMDTKRRELLDYLAENHINVLCGHVHRFTHEVYQSEKGSFTQITICAAIDNFAWTKEPIKNEIGCETCDFLPEINYDRVKDPEEMKAFLAEYNGKIKDPVNYFAFGYGIMTIDDDNKVKFDWYFYNDDKPFASFDIK